MVNAYALPTQSSLGGGIISQLVLDTKFILVSYGHAAPHPSPPQAHIHQCNQFLPFCRLPVRLKTTKPGEVVLLVYVLLSFL